MSITQARFTSQLRTWILVAGLTALLIGIGALIGGKFLYIFVIFAVVMNVAGYWFSDKIALRASRAKPVSEQEAPQLYKILRELTERAELPMPRVYMIPSEQPNAFATGRNAEARGRRRHRRPDAAAPRGSDPRRARARALAREEPRHPRHVDRGHDRGRDRGHRQHPAVLVPVRRLLGRRGQPARLHRRARDDHPRADRGRAPADGGLAAARVPRGRNRRSPARHRQAARRRARDARAGRAGGAAPGQPRDGVALHRPSVPRGQGVANMFSTHPPLAERIRRLREYDAAQGIHYG